MNYIKETGTTSFSTTSFSLHGPSLSGTPITPQQSMKSIWTAAFSQLRAANTKSIAVESAIRLSLLIGLKGNKLRFSEALNHLRLAYGLDPQNPRVLCGLTDLGYVQGME